MLNIEKRAFLITEGLVFCISYEGLFFRIHFETHGDRSK
jgi:hypothetical protein